MLSALDPFGGMDMKKERVKKVSTISKFDGIVR